VFSLLSASELEQRIERQFMLGREGTLYLRNINGRIAVATGKQQSIDIKAVKMADDREALDKVQVEFKQEGKDLKVFVHDQDRHGRVKVDFEVLLPEEIHWSELHSTNGSIDASGVFGDVVLESINGEVTLEGQAREITCTTVNGEITVTLDSVLGGDLSAKTVNGGVTIEIPQRSRFSVEGKTLNGSISSEFPLTVDKGFIGSKVFGTVNDGQYKLMIKTLNGSIRIRKN
jgi:hypothetical protein